MENQSHNLDLSISKTALPDDTECKINIQANAIADLVNILPYYFENQCANLSKLQETAIEELKNQSDIDEDSCNRQLEELQAHYSFLIEQQLEFKNTANHAIFLLIFAYFESIVTQIRVSQGLSPIFGIKKTDVTEAMDKCGCKLSKEAEEALDYLVGTVKEIRNLLTHNYNGSTTSDDKYKRQIDIAKDEQNKGIGFAIDRGRYILKKEYLLYIQSKIGLVIRSIYKSTK